MGEYRSTPPPWPTMAHPGQVGFRMPRRPDQMSDTPTPDPIDDEPVEEDEPDPELEAEPAS